MKMLSPPPKLNSVAAMVFGTSAADVQSSHARSLDYANRQRNSPAPTGEKVTRWWGWRCAFTFGCQGDRQQETHTQRWQWWHTFTPRQEGCPQEAGSQRGSTSQDGRCSKSTLGETQEACKIKRPGITPGPSSPKRRRPYGNHPKGPTGLARCTLPDSKELYSAFFLLGHITRQLVFPDAYKAGMPEVICVCPVGIIHLYDHVWPDPYAFRHFLCGHSLTPPV